MLINLTDVFTEEEKSVTKEVPLELTSYDFRVRVLGFLRKHPSCLLCQQWSGRALIEAGCRGDCGVEM